MSGLIYAGPDNIRPNRDRKDCEIVKETIINTCISKKLRKFLNDHCSIVIAYESSYYNTVVYKISEVIKIAKTFQNFEWLMKELEKIKDYDYLEI